MRVGMRMARRLFGVKDETVSGADRQGGIEHNHPDGEGHNQALHGCRSST